MREVAASDIKNKVQELFMEANYIIGSDVMEKIHKACENEKSEIAKYVLCQLEENHKLGAKERIPVCQDTGMAVVFLEIGQEVLIVGGDLTNAVNEGVKEAYDKGYLRKSVVSEPLFDRKNTQDNTPAVIHMEIVPGDKVKIVACPKGFGSENMSAVKMLKPSEGIQGVKDFITETVIKAGPNPCPPTVIGVGIGGTLEKSALTAKKALLRSIDKRNPDPRYAQLETEILECINRSGIGPGGLGGKTTALAVNIDYFATHIAGLPVAVNICCHVVRHAEAIL